MWKKRELSIFGKILIIKTLAISKITFLLLNLIPPNDIIKKIKTLLFNFIWGKRDRIKRHILRQDIIHGGVNMLDIETYCLALSASWVPQIINSQQNNWSFYGKQYLRSFDDISKLNYTDSLVFEKLNSLPSFYKNIIISFCKVNQTEKPVSRDEILNTYIWGNKWISYETASKKHVIYFKSWIESGIIYVKDIKVTQGSIDERYIYNKLRTKNNYLAEIFTLKKALQTYLSTILENIPIERLENATQNQENDRIIPLLRCLEFSTIYQKKILDIKENKLAEFNYKVLHNILPCGVNLYMWRIIDTKKCDICNIDEDISHLLYNCEIANSIWRILSKILQRNISTTDVIISEHCEPHIVDVITIICYGIFKYWILSKDTKTKRNVNTFLASLRAYINNRCMYDLHWQKLYLNKDTVNILKRIRDTAF